MPDIAERRKENDVPEVNILGVPIGRLNLEQAAKVIVQAWEEGRFLHVVTANAEMLYRCSRDKVLQKIAGEAGLVTADGAGVVWASRILKGTVPERVAGFDLMLLCLKEAARASRSLYFLGSRPDVLGQALARVRKDYPGLEIAGAHHGYFQEDEEEALLKEICLCRPALLLVAMGVPRQEKWIARHRKKLPPCAVIGVGGSFDVLAGKVRRAPLWMQRAGLEWLYRLLKEPSRLGRTAALPLFVFAVLRQALQGARGQ